MANYKWKIVSYIKKKREKKHAMVKMRQMCPKLLLIDGKMAQTMDYRHLGPVRCEMAVVAL